MVISHTGGIIQAIVKITSIEPQKKKLDRVNVFIDGRFAFGLSQALRFENKLEVGQEISESRIKELVEKDQIERLFNKALRFLSYRPRSEKEITDHLLRKGKLLDLKSEDEVAQYNESVEKTIKNLKRLDQVDDDAFAKWWIEQRLKFKPQAIGVIKRELLAKGIDQDVIEETIGAVKKAEGTGDEDLALRAAEKKLISYKNLGPEDFKIKMGRYLARKGFSWEVIKKVVDSFLEKRVK
jgi:regulatory protein